MKNIPNRIADRIEREFKKFCEDTMPPQNINVPDSQMTQMNQQPDQQQIAQLKAQQLKAVTDQRKQLQDQIKQTQDQLNMLKKQLAGLNNPGNVTVNVAENQRVKK